MDKKRTYILFAVITLTCAAGNLSQTATNSMLTSIQESFGTPESISQWLTTMYMLVIGITVPLITHLSKRLSARTLILIAQVFGIIGAILGAVAPSFAILLVARVLQAIGTGITLPLIQTVAMTRFPPGKNATAMGIAGIAMGFAPNIGPVVGGALASTLGWRSFFWLFAILLAILLVSALLFIGKREREMQKAHLDYISALLSTLGFGGLLLAFSSAASSSITDPTIWISFVIGIVCIVWFVLRQKRIEHPLISMSIFRSRTYTWAFVIQGFLYPSFMGITLILPLFIINVSGLSALDAGMVFLPTTVIAILFNPLAGIASDRFGARPVLIAAGACLSIGAVATAFIGAETPFWVIAILQAIRGIGVSSTIGPITSWGMHRLTPANMMDGSAFVATMRYVFAALGTACMMLFVVLAGGALGYTLALAFSALLSLGVFIGAILFVRDLDS